MRQLTYALRFRGEAKRVGIDGTVLAIAFSAPGCTIRTRIEPTGLSGSLELGLGDEATLDSEWVFTSATTFQEESSIVFGQSGHWLRFSTLGSAYLGPATNDGRRHGAAIRRVDGGAGQFAGATGLIASTFVVNDAGEVTDYQLGVVDIRSEDGSPGTGTGRRSSERLI